MPFSTKNLNANETVALDMHPHWWYFSHPTMALATAIVVGIVVLTSGPDGNVGDVLRIIVVAALVGGAAWLVVRYLKWMTTYFVITSNRVIFRTGVLAKSGIEIPLERVNNVNFNQSIFERMLGAGDLLIESGGEDGQSRFSDIRHPDQVQRLIHSQMEGAMQRRASGSVAAAPTTVDVAEQLERLEAMMQRGSLTSDEFEIQKRKLLGA